MYARLLCTSSFAKNLVRLRVTRVLGLELETRVRVLIIAY